MSIKIALAGNPNSGKTTIFNALTGSSQYVGNWPGVTVEKKDGRLRGRPDVTIQDLPGIYSLSPYSLEEVVSRNYLVKDRPDAIINIVDAANLERNLYLTTQLLELGIPTVVALNMMDIVAKRGDKINVAGLAEAIGCPVIETTATGPRVKSLSEAVNVAVELAEANHSGVFKIERRRDLVQDKKTAANQPRFAQPVEQALAAIAEELAKAGGVENLRWASVKVFERDERLLEELTLSEQAAQRIEELICTCESALEDDAESIVTNERYAYVTRLLAPHLQKHGRQGELSASDKIDKVVTNRFLALPIFAVIIFFIYYVSITSVGTVLTDWANDGVFGDGWHLFGTGRLAYEDAAATYGQAQAEIEAYLAAAEGSGLDIAAVAETLAAEEPNPDIVGQFVLAANDADLTATLTLEAEGAAPETVEITAGSFLAAANLTEPDPAEFGVWIPGIPPLIEGLLNKLNCAYWLQSLILDGVVAGVGAVLGFVPQMMVLFIFLGILEDCGYMARIAFIMDRLFRNFGLSGKNVIPMLVATGCGVPGVTATRTIENESDRKIAVVTTTFMPCGAKLPIIALIAGALFANSGWVAPAAYFVGIGAILVSGVILKKTRGFAGDPSPFVMELPAYHLPQAKTVLLHTWDRSKSFVKKACTIIMLSTVVLWFLGSYNTALQPVGTADSILADIGQTVAPVFTPLGWGDQWEAAVGTVTGLIAKENVVATFGSLYAGLDEVSEDGAELWAVVAAKFTPLAALSFMLFNLLCAPCFAAIGAIRREMGSAKLAALAVGYQCLLAYAVAMVVYQLGTALTGGGFGAATIAALLVLAGFLYLLFRPDPHKKQTQEHRVLNYKEA